MKLRKEFVHQLHANLVTELHITFIRKSSLKITTKTVEKNTPRQTYKFHFLCVLIQIHLIYTLTQLRFKELRSDVFAR